MTGLMSLGNLIIRWMAIRFEGFGSDGQVSMVLDLIDIDWVLVIRLIINLSE